MRLTTESVNNSRLDGMFSIEGSQKEFAKIEIIERILNNIEGVIATESANNEYETYVLFIYCKCSIDFDEIKKKYKSLKKALS